ncbi:uncharacterized protein LOC126188626 isoform X2 [Schistocerca cancellata]|uniref:uncharacterized protein LOC126188626 isoform X2 n=1 Tax=Schistocerca cancellata TaxID=274614 RepID=UPI00211948D2|nr:uncharacterized protein LOC126188626 isoform X2 [Schistocerca cancellata]
MKPRGRSEEPRSPGAAAAAVGQPRSRRDSSASSLGSGVRCACQFYQSDSLLPERAAQRAALQTHQRPSSRPPSRTADSPTTSPAATMQRPRPASGEHLYEPISPPPEVTKMTDKEAKSAVAAEMSDVDMADDLADEEMLKDVAELGPRTASADSRERRFLGAALEDSLAVPDDGTEEDVAMAGPQLGDSANGQPAAAAADAAAADAEAERRYMATPTPTTTTESRTDCDINTSQLDSSGLEDLPLKRGARKRITAEPEAAQLGLQQRLRSQAGRLRSKIRGMSRPKFSMPERPKFNLPDRPKFNLPERPKFNMPDRPRFHLPDRPKFSLPERPKFNMPERPKFHLPDRPKFHMPQRPKFTMPGAAKTPEDEEKKKKKKPTSSIRRPLRDRASTVSTASSTAGGHKRLFDFDFRSYPRIFDRAKRSRDYATSSPKAGPRKLTPPPQQVRVPPARKKGPVGQRWLHRFTDIKFADDEENLPDLGDDEEEGGPPGERARAPLPAHEPSDEDEPRTESTAPFHDKDFGYAISLERRDQPPDADTRYGRAEEPASVGDSDREQRSSGSSSDRRRAGVLEEIDSDEFFLREKGISQEDVAVGRYLTSEIRDAFRSPVNALRRMDADEDGGGGRESPLAAQYRGTPEREPERPARTRSLRPARRRHSPSPPAEAAQPDFGTFPPARPKRNRRAPLLQQAPPPPPPPEADRPERDHLQQESQQQQEEEPEKELQKQQQRHEDDADIDAVPAAEDDEAKRAEEPTARAPPTLTLTGPQESVETQQSADERQWAMEVEDEEQPLPQPEPPQPPKRKRRSRRDLSDIPPGGARYANQDFDAGDASPARYGSEDFAAQPRYANENFAAESADRLHSDVSATEGDRYANGSFVEAHDRYRLNEVPTIRRYTTEDVSDFKVEEEIRYAEDAEEKVEGRYVNGDALLDDYRRHSVDARLPVVNGHYTKEDWLESVQSSKHEAALALEPDYIIPGEGEGEPGPRQPPVAPRRLRRRAAGSSRGTSLADEDATSRGAESLPSEAEHEPEAEAEADQEAEAEAEAEAEPGYAAVVARPRAPSRRTKPKSPRRRSLPVTPRFFSLPRRALRPAPPVRPVRNYSTLGPSRPPRRTRLLQQQQQYVEIDEAVSKSLEGDEEEAAAVDGGAAGASSALQAGDVVERMKGRPLPPPPRPPRKQRDAREDAQEGEDDTALPESIAEAARREAEEEEPLVGALREDAMDVEAMDADEEPSAAEEASVATQTDPLPDDVCVEPASDEPPPTFADASTETELKAAVTTQPKAKVQEEIRELREQMEALSEESARLKAEQEALQKAAETKAMMQEARMTASVDQPHEPATPQPQPQPPPEPIIIEKPVPFYVMPDADTEVELKARRLEVSELDVGRLTVGELQARKMVVSDVDSVSLQAAEFSSKTTNLAVSTLELPSGLLQELRDSLQAQQTAESESQEPVQTTRTEVTELQAAPAAEYRQAAQPQPTSTIPPSVSRHRHREYESEEEEEVPVSVSTPVSRRRRHIPRPQLRHSSTDEEEPELPISRPVSRGRSRVAAGAVGSEANAVELGRQLIATCQAAAVRALNRSVQYACSVANIDSEQHRRELQVVLCGLLVAVAALVLFGFGSGKTFHYHHWDYVFPPP